MNSKLMSTVVASLVFSIAADSTVAAGRVGVAKATSTTIPVSFTITSDGCPSLPAGTVLEGSGTRTDIINTHVSGDVTRQTITSHAYGHATDQLGNSYAWDYSSQQNESNTAPSLDWAGTFVDHFSLAGAGPAHIVAGFVADVFHDTDFTYFFFTPQIVIGDPIGFDDLSFHCDPM